MVPPYQDAQWWRIQSIANGLKSTGIEVDIIHYIAKGFGAHKYMKSNKLEKHNNLLVVISPIFIPFKHLLILSRKNYDIVYGNTYFSTFFSILGKMTGKPLILDMHGISDEFLLLEQKPSSFKMSLMKVMESISLRFSDKIVCVSRSMIDYLHNKKGIPLNKMIYGTNGVDLDFFKPVNIEEIRKMKQLLNIEEDFVFGYIGGFQGYQGVENFIETAKNIEKERVKFLILGGDKNSREDNILFISRIPREQIPNYYSICDVLVLPRPSHIATEVAAPTKFAEYAAMGKPILTTNVGDAAYLIRKYKNGIVVENNSVEALKKGINEFVDIDQNKIIMMGINSRKLAECEFDWNIICNKIHMKLKG